MHHQLTEIVVTTLVVSTYARIDDDREYEWGDDLDAHVSDSLRQEVR